MPGEFDIIRQYFDRPSGRSDVVVGVGDDAACVTPGDGSLAICVDALVEDVHFPAGTPPRAIGHRAVAVNLSDLAACGARPAWLTLALSMPRADTQWLADFAAGFFELADAFGADLIGGDTVRGPLQVTVQAIGRVHGSLLRRDGGSPGDDVYLSGPVGDAAGGLRRIARDDPNHPLARRFFYPVPRVELGIGLVNWASACIDVSDGLAVDLDRLASASGAGARLALDRLPLSEALRQAYPDDEAQYLALNGGDDYELCFTVAQAKRSAFASWCEEHGHTPTRIGELTPDPSLVLTQHGEVVTRTLAGFDHFSDDAL